MSFFRRGASPAWLLLCLAALGLTALAGRAADDAPPPLDAKAVDAAVFKTLREVINEGADMYNAQGKYVNEERDYAGCYHLYQGALIATRPLLASRPELQKVIDDGLDNARNTPDVARRAFVLREVIDKVRETVNPNPKAVVTPAKTLWDRLGGEAGVSKVVDDLVTAAAADPKVDFTRGGKYKLDADGAKHLKKELVNFISSATGGPFDYKGKSMKDVHKGMGITDAEFDALGKDLKDALDKNGVKADDVKAVLTVVETTRKDIVEGKAPPPPLPVEKTTKGAVTKAESLRLTVKTDDGKESVFAVSDDAAVTIDGKSGRVDDIKKDSTVTVTQKGDVVTKIEAKSPTAPPPSKVTTVLGKVVGVDKDKLTVSVDDKDKVFTVPAAAKVTIDEKDGKLEDLKKDSNVLVTSKDDAVVTIEAKSPLPPPPPKETTTKGTVTKNDKGKLTVKDDAGKETTVLVPLNAKVTIDGKDGEAEDIKADSTVTVTSDKDGKVTKVEVKGPGAPPPGDTLWDRLGGEAKVAKVVDDFVNTVVKDAKVNFYRDPTFEPSNEQVAALKKKLVEFVSSAAGGPLKYTGKDMKEAHKGMKITDDEFNALAADLKAALEKNGAKADDVKAVLALVEGTRKDIVEVKAPEDKDKPKPPDDKPKPPDDKPGETGSINGKVTYKNAPLAGGTVTFVGADGKAYAAPVAADGSYSLKDLKAGPYKVTLVPDPNKASVLPAKYQKPETTSLVIEVKKGEATNDIALD